MRALALALLLPGTHPDPLTDALDVEAGYRASWVTAQEPLPEPLPTSCWTRELRRPPATVEQSCMFYEETRRRQPRRRRRPRRPAAGA